jgi:hypothetical protein
MHAWAACGPPKRFCAILAPAYGQKGEDAYLYGRLNNNSYREAYVEVVASKLDSGPGSAGDC